MESGRATSQGGGRQALDLARWSLAISSTLTYSPNQKLNFLALIRLSSSLILLWFFIIPSHSLSDTVFLKLTLLTISSSSSQPLNTPTSNPSATSRSVNYLDLSKLGNEGETPNSDEIWVTVEDDNKFLTSDTETYSVATDKVRQLSNLFFSSNRLSRQWSSKLWFILANSCQLWSIISNFIYIFFFFFAYFFVIVVNF